MRKLKAKAKCIECLCCDPEHLMCYPNDPDCHKEYKLDPEDLYTPEHCDFFIAKEESDKIAKKILADMAGMPVDASLNDITKQLIFCNNMDRKQQITNAINISNNLIAVYPKGKERDFDS